MDQMDERRRRILERGKRRLDSISSGRILRDDTRNDDPSERTRPQIPGRALDDTAANTNRNSDVVKSVIEVLLKPEDETSSPVTEADEREEQKADRTAAADAAEKTERLSKSNKPAPDVLNDQRGERRHIRSFMRIVIGVALIEKFSAYFFGYGLLILGVLNGLAIYFTEIKKPLPPGDLGTILIVRGSSMLQVARYMAQDIAVFLFLLCLLSSL